MSRGHRPCCSLHPYEDHGKALLEGGLVIDVLEMPPWMSWFFALLVTAAHRRGAPPAQGGVRPRPGRPPRGSSEHCPWGVYWPCRDCIFFGSSGFSSSRLKRAPFC